jgi:hypothetical protein
MPQGQNFSLEVCLLPIANAQQVDQKPDDRVTAGLQSWFGMIPGRGIPPLKVPKSS